MYREMHNTFIEMYNDEMFSKDVRRLWDPLLLRALQVGKFTFEWTNCEVVKHGGIKKARYYILRNQLKDAGLIEYQSIQGSSRIIYTLHVPRKEQERMSN